MSAPRSEVRTLGASANLAKGDLSSHANLADFKAKQHLYALGPVQHMGGEVLVIDSVPYAAQIRNGHVSVSSSWDYQPPFLVYSQVERWRALALPDHVKTYADVESYLGVLAKRYGWSEDIAFAFMLRAKPVNMTVGVFDMPASAEPGQRPLSSYNTAWEVHGEPVEFIGFYSTRDRGLFLSGNERVHTHAITSDRGMAGHVQSFELSPGGTIYLPR